MSSPNLGSARGAIQIDTSQLNQVEARTRAVGQQVARNLGQIDASARKVQSSIGGLDLSLRSLAGAFGVGVGISGLLQLGQVAIDLAKTAAQAGRSKDAFDKLAAGVGDSGDRMLASMRKASAGMISDQRLVQTGNQAMMLKAADTNEEMIKLIEIARVRAAASGKTFEDAFSRLALGIGKREPEILDEIGLVLRLIPAYDAYARKLGTTADQLTEAQKTQALFNDVVRQSKDILEANAGAADDAASKFERYQAAVENAKKAAGETLLQAGAANVAEFLAKGLQNTQTGLSAFLDTNKESARSNNIADVQYQITIAENDRRLLSEGLKILEGNRGTEFFDQGAIDRQNGLLAENNTQLAQLKVALSTAVSKGLPVPPGGVPVFAGGSSPPAFTDVQLEKQRAAKLDFEESIRSIEADAQSARLDTTRQYESQRTDTIRDYEQTIARDAADFGRQRARAEAQFAKQVADIAEDAGKREADAAEDLADKISDLQGDTADRIADAQENTAKRIADIEEDYRRNRERAERDHRDNLLGAAARLDAVGVFNEQKRFARESADAKDAHDEALSDAQEALQERTAQEAENLSERIQQEQESHAERLQEARDADAERLTEMQEAFSEAKRLEDEDRAIRLARMAEDQAQQLASMDAAHALEMAEIEQQKADELKANQEAHLKELEAAGIFNKAWKDIQDARQREALQSWDLWWKGINQRFAVQGAPTPAQQQQNQWSGANLTSPVPLTSPPSTRGGDVRNFNVAPGAIQVFASSGQNAQSIANEVHQRMIEIFKELAN